MSDNLQNQDNSIKISVIVPVYNAAKFIWDCVECLLSQTLNDMEFIFVNDGSTDESLSRLEKYQYHPKIRIFSQLNKGVSAARNFGLDQAKGEYIGFLDADDIHETTLYEKLWQKAIDKNDVVISDILLERDGKLIEKKAHFCYNKKFSNDEINNEIIPYMLCIEDPTLLSVNNKIFKKELLDKHQIRFQENIRLEEDTLFNLMTFYHAEFIEFIEFNGYHHKNNPNSVTRDFLTNNIFEKILDRFHLNYRKFVNLDISKEELNKFQCSRLVYSINILFFKTATTKGITKKDRMIFLKKILKNSDVQKAVENLHPDYEKKMGKLEKLIVYFIKNKKSKIAICFAHLLGTVYTPKLSEILRKINRK